MKRLTRALFVLSVAMGVAHAGSSNDELARKTQQYDAYRAASPAVDLLSATDGALRPFDVAAPAGICDPGTLNLIVHDDGQGENGYGWNPTAGTDGRYADKFTPAAYPATINTVCMSFITNAGVTSFNFKVAVYAADGAGGAPGTLLGSKAFVGHPASIAGLPFTPTFETFDISDLALNITSGSVYISANWDATAGTSGVFIGVDESTSTPMAGGYNYSGTGPWGALGGTNQPNYRALMIRAVMPLAGPGAPSLTKAFAPAQVLAGVKSTLTITLNNSSQPTAAVLSAALTDTFPTGVVVAATPNAATTCTGGTVTAVAGSGSVSLNSGASIPASGSCTIKVDVSSATDGTYVNTIAAGALKTQHGNNAGAATATLKVGLTFPEPYCGVTFPSNVEPITHVLFAGIDNVTSATLNGSPALEDFTARLGTVLPGNTYSMAVEGNTDGNFTTSIKVYVDWNHNGVFTDADEAYVIGTIVNSTGTDGKQAVANIVVPATAMTGQTRMRVIKKFGATSDPGPCNNAGFGQAEDYTLTVGGIVSEVVCSAPLNHAIVNNIDGTSINWSTGAIVDAGPSSGYDFNPYGSGNKLAFFWSQSAVGAGVADAATGTGWKVLQVGDQIGPTSVFSRGTGAATNWDGGVDGYLGFKFDCSSIPNAPSSGLCYGYTHMTSTGPNGFPATLVDYCYNKAGNAITIAPAAAPPAIGVTPANLSASVQVGATTTKTLAIANTGGSDLHWTISEASPANTGGTPARQSAHRDASQRVPFERDFAQFPMANVIADGGFEQGDPNPVWDVFSQNFGTVLCTVADCGTGSGTGPHGGSWWAWFGGINAAETGYVRQTVTIPSGTASLSFWLQVPVSSGLAADFLKVSIDGTEVWRVTGSTASAYGSYTKVTVDVSAFATGGSHLLSFDSTVVGGATNLSNFFVDDVALDAGGGGGGCSAPSDLPWASVNPASGTTAAGASSNVTVTFNASGLAAGPYNGLLCVGSDDPVNPLVAVPVALTVTPADGNPNGVITAGPFNHAIQQTTAGTSLNIVSSAFDDNGPISGNWDFNFWNSSGLALWKIGGANDGQYAVDGSGKALLMQPGDTVGASNTFTSGTGLVSMAAGWLAGTDGYLGVKFNCNGRLANPVAGVCYGYVHIKTTGATGFPATILDTAFDGDNQTITIVGPTVGPIAEVTPLAGFDFTVDEGSTGTDTMIVKNVGQGTLTYSIAESAARDLNPPSYKTAAERASKGNPTGIDLSAELVAARSLGHNGFGDPLVLDATMISQMDDNTPGDQGVSCGQTGVSTSDNSWWRRFYFSEHAAVGASAAITGVTVSGGSIAVPGGLPVTINLYTIAHSTPVNTIPTSGLTLIGTANGVINGSLQSVTIPVTGTVSDTVGKDLVVEYHTDGSTAGQFFPGANATAESHPTFISSTGCGIAQPTTAAGIGFPDFHLTMVVNVGGTPQPGCDSPSDIPWLSATPATGSVAGGASSNVAVTVDASGLTAGDYSANLCVTTNDPAHALFTVPVHVTVESAIADAIFCSGFEDGETGACGGTTPLPFTQPLQDPGFEATSVSGGSNPFWAGTDTNDPAGGTPFYTNGARTGAMGVWFGGWRATAETQTFSQSVTIASGGPRFINYWRNVVLSPVGTATLKVYVDGTAVETTNIVANGLDPTWVNKSIDISSYANDASHTIKFEYVTAGSDDGNVFIDDVTINEQAGSARSSR